MTQDKHTALPWKLVEGYYGPIIDGHDGQERICTVDGGRPVGEKDANADFIVRAVNNHYQLVEALERYEDQARFIAKHFTQDMKNIDPIMAVLTELALDGGAKARQALSNAKGEDDEAN